MTARDTTGAHDKRGVATDVEQITCPECGGTGLVDYYAVGADCPCMTCSGGLYEQGTGTIPAPDAPKVKASTQLAPAGGPRHQATSRWIARPAERTPR